MDWGGKAAELLEQVRRERPLVHHITNLVVTNLTANATLAVGAAPVMAHAPAEVAAMARLARALVLNIGTLDERQVESMLLAGQAANAAGVPVILDPVGAGATDLRTHTARHLLSALQVTVLRGNAGEVGVLSGLGGRVQGVDAAGAGAPAAQLAREAARRLQVVAAVTGAVDYVAAASGAGDEGRVPGGEGHVPDGEGLVPSGEGPVASGEGRLVAVANGHPLLQAVTGTGCTATSVIAAFVAVAPDPLVGAACALAYYGYAAEVAARESRGPGSFQVALLDALYTLTPAQVAAGVRVSWEG